MALEVATCHACDAFLWELDNRADVVTGGEEEIRERWSEHKDADHPLYTIGKDALSEEQKRIFAQASAAQVRRHLESYGDEIGEVVIVYWEQACGQP